jgi:hypothetical protein
METRDGVAALTVKFTVPVVPPEKGSVGTVPIKTEHAAGGIDVHKAHDVAMKRRDSFKRVAKACGKENARIEKQDSLARTGLGALKACLKAALVLFQSENFHLLSVSAT